MPKSGLRSRSLASGDKLGKFELIRQVAVGGMAELYLARTTGIEGFEKLVVVKRMLPQYAKDQAFVSMFLAEARLSATLHHPNIAQVYDIGIEEGDYFFSMEYVHGEDLGHLHEASVQQGVPMSLDAVLTLATGLCAGLHYAHEKTGPDGRPLGVVHRDVSPSNVLVSYDGGVKVVDFGIARAGNSPRTTQGGLKGKIEYMSPEQCRGLATLDRRSDIYAIGTILYELTTGQRPFSGASDFALLEQIVHEDAPSPSRIVPDYPPALAAIIDKALARDPVKRFSTALEMQGQLEDFAHESRIRISPLVLVRVMSSLFPARLEEWDQARAQGAFFVEQHIVRTLAESGRTPAPGDEGLVAVPQVDAMPVGGNPFDDQGTRREQNNPFDLEPDGTTPGESEYAHDTRLESKSPFANLNAQTKVIPGVAKKSPFSPDDIDTAPEQANPAGPGLARQLAGGSGFEVDEDGLTTPEQGKAPRRPTPAPTKRLSVPAIPNRAQSPSKVPAIPNRPSSPSTVPAIPNRPSSPSTAPTGGTARIVSTPAGISSARTPAPETFAAVPRAPNRSPTPPSTPVPVGSTPGRASSPVLGGDAQRSSSSALGGDAQRASSPALGAASGNRASSPALGTAPGNRASSPVLGAAPGTLASSSIPSRSSQPRMPSPEVDPASAALKTAPMIPVPPGGFQIPGAVPITGPIVAVNAPVDAAIDALEDEAQTVRRTPPPDQRAAITEVVRAAQAQSAQTQLAQSAQAHAQPGQAYAPPASFPPSKSFVPTGASDAIASMPPGAPGAMPGTTPGAPAYVPMGAGTLVSNRAPDGAIPTPMSSSAVDVTERVRLHKVRGETEFVGEKSRAPVIITVAILIVGAAIGGYFFLEHRKAQNVAAPVTEPARDQPAIAIDAAPTAEPAMTVDAAVVEIDAAVEVDATVEVDAAVEEVAPVVDAAVAEPKVDEPKVDEPVKTTKTKLPTKKTPKKIVPKKVPKKTSTKKVTPWNADSPLLPGQ